MPESFYVTDGDGFRSTTLTRGPWDPDAQHASPPAALIGRVVERHLPRDDLRVARLTCDILRPVPITPVTVAVRTVREGRSAWRVEASLATDGAEAVRASALLLRTAQPPLSATVPAEGPPPGPETGVVRPFFPVGWDEGYHTATDIRFVAGAFTEPGPATVWLRTRVPLVDDEEPSPLVRALLVADVGNGASATLDFRRYVFVNADLTVHLHRYPAGDWVCLDAVTATDAAGIGLAVSRLADTGGGIGRALQSLFVAER